MKQDDRTPGLTFTKNKQRLFHRTALTDWFL